MGFAQRPGYTFGAAARGLSFNVGSNLLLNLKVPDANKLVGLAPDTRDLLVDYFGATGGALEPLRSVQALPDLPPLGEPPAYQDELVSFQSDTLAAAIYSFRILASNSTVLGYDTLEHAVNATTNLAAAVRRELERTGRNILDAKDALAQARQAAELETCRNDRRAALAKLLSQARTLQTSPVGPFQNATRGLSGDFSQVLKKDDFDNARSSLRDALAAAMADDEAVADPTSARMIVQIAELLRAAEQSSLVPAQLLAATKAPGAASPQATDFTDFVLAARGALLTDLGLNPETAAVQDASKLAGQSDDALKKAVLELTGQETALQLYDADDHARFDSAITQIYAARRNLVAARIREIQQQPLPANHNLEVVRQVRIMAEAAAPALNNEEMAQLAGANGLIEITDIDGTKKMVQAADAGTQMNEFIADDIAQVNGFVARVLAGQATTEERLAWEQVVKPTLDKLAQDKKRGVPAIVGPARTLLRPFNLSTPRFPAETLAKLAGSLERLARVRLDALTDQARRLKEASLGSTTEALSLFADAVGVAELIDLSAADQERVELLGLLQTQVFTKVTAKLTGTAQAKRAWWYTQREAKLLVETLHNQAYSNSQQLKTVLERELQSTLESTRGLMVILGNDIQWTTLPVDLKLPGQIVINDVHGELTFNRQSGYVSGKFGGSMTFPDLGGAAFAVRELKLDTDGNFFFSAAAAFPVPERFTPTGLGYTHPHFSGTLTLSGHKELKLNPDGSLNLDGTLKLTGAGTLTFAENPKGVTATLTYEQVIDANNLAQWHFTVSLSGAVNKSFGDDFYLFDAAFGAGAVGDGTSLRIGGKAGLFHKVPLPTNGDPVLPSMFHILVEDVQLEESNTLSVLTVRLNGRRVRLPPLFSNLATNLCGPRSTNDGVEVSIPPGHPITVTFDITTPSDPHLTFSGGIMFSNVGFEVPIIPGMQGAICSAELLFSSGDLPTLEHLNGTLLLPLPNQTNFLDLREGSFSLHGLPTGTISIRDDLTLARVGGFKLSAIGTNGCGGGTGIMVTNPPGEVGLFKVFGGLRLDLPAFMLTGASNDAVSVASCGHVTLTVHSNGPPDFEFGMDVLKACIDKAHLGGASGLVVTGACLTLSNLNYLLVPSTEHPFVVQLDGSVQLPNNGPVLSLSGAQLSVHDRDSLPDFAISGLSYDATRAEWTLMPGLLLQITKVKFKFVDSLRPFPERLRPDNVLLTLSASLILPNKNNPVLGGAVDDLTIGFYANGLPKPPTMDGFDMIVQPGAFKLPPINDLGGRIHIGGLQAALNLNDPTHPDPTKLYLVGRLAGSYSSYKIAFLAAFTITGPVGMCLDVNAGTAGIPIGPTGFLITGASGGASFLNDGSDPCQFASYFMVDPAAGNTVMKPTAPAALVSMGWDQFKKIVDDMEARAKQFVKQSGAPSPAPLLRAKMDSGDTGTVRTATNDLAIPCPGDCPPATVNILCQPHPAIPGRVIFKFTAIDEPTLNSLGITRDNPIIQRGVQAAPEIGVLVASNITEFARALTPPVPDNLPDYNLKTNLIAAREGAFALLSNSVVALVTNAISTNVTHSVYDDLTNLVWQGIPCFDITETFAGRVSYVGVGNFAYLEGQAVISSAGNAGVVGTVNVIGVPFAQARVFVAATDAKGELNPSLCGQAKLALGPLEAGMVRLAYECPGCVTEIVKVFPTLAGALSETLVRDMISRCAPAVSNLNSLNKSQLISAVLNLAPDESAAAIRGFFIELMNQPPGALPSNIGNILVNALTPVLKDLNPTLTVCGQVQPKLFGFPLSPTPLASLSALANREGYVGSFSFAPSFMVSYLFPILPPADQSTFSWDLRARDPGYLLSGALDGSLSTPEGAKEYAKEHIDYALEHSVFAMDYQFHPFGLHVADAGARIMMPDLLNHPALQMPPRKPAWELDPTLPSPFQVLVQAANSNLLGNAFGWHGTTNDFAKIFPADSTEHARLQTLDLRKDYFPYGGLLGGGQLSIPLILTESPTNWLPLVVNVQTNSDPFQKLSSGMDLVQKHILQTTNCGEFAFYLPAPNPPVLFDTNGTRLDNAVVRATTGINPSSVTAQQIIDSI